VSAFDGTSWSAIKEFHVTALPDRPPVVTASGMTLPGATKVAIGSLFTASDPDGDAITMYTVYDNTLNPNTGHLLVNGVAQAKLLYQPIYLTAQQFAQTTFQTGASGSDDVYVSAFDGTSWSAVKEFHVGAVNNAPITIGTGQTVEIASSYSGVVTFAASTGTLRLDTSTTFAGTIGGQLAIGDVIDLADINAGANATIGYSGNNSPGTLTVSDGTHTASIALLGNYSLANFTASSDGHGGTSVIDPPLTGGNAVYTAKDPADSQGVLNQQTVLLHQSMASFAPTESGGSGTSKDAVLAYDLGQLTNLAQPVADQQHP
jgi:hypothetical protein